MSFNPENTRLDSTPGTIEPINAHVGQRIRSCRMHRGMSQERLSELICVTREQMQRYESGLDRVTAVPLFDITGALDIPLGFFFADGGEPDGRGRTYGPIAA